MPSPFFRLHPTLRHAIVHDLGWRTLRPVQEAAVDAVLDGHNAVILAPTAGGKTEASVFPVLSRILSEEIPPVAALYLCPIRALLNNQEDRLGAYARRVGLDVFKWHGDVAASAKERFRRQPAHLLMITPESLEVMLIGQKTDARSLFAATRAVIIDEIHAFAGDDRGAHLMCLLERLTRFCGRDLQRIGLSATVGEPERLGDWLQGSSERPFTLVDPPRSAPDPDVRLELAPDLSTAASTIERLVAGRKSLVFVDARSQAESISRNLRGTDLDVYVHHSAISRADRKQAEERFRGGSQAAIVCTSTLELGLDIGDLDRVVQLEAPSTVASYLQRLGRTGRRAGTRANCRFVTTRVENLLQALALLRLASRGFVETLRPSRRAFAVLAHQILALTLQEGGVSRHRLLPWIQSASPFAELTGEDVDTLVSTMLERDILYEADGLLSLGAHGEKLYGKKNFFELYAVFTTPRVFRVLHGLEEIGTVEASFLERHDLDEGPLTFLLGGRAWQVARVEWTKGLLRVRKASHGRVPSWIGSPTSLSFELCQEMRRALLEEHPAEAEWLAPAARAELTVLREDHAHLLAHAPAPLERDGDILRWHTFAGGAINHLLAAALEAATSSSWTVGNLSVKVKDLHPHAAQRAIRELGEIDWHTLAHESAPRQMPGTRSKFAPCLPETIERQRRAEGLFDVEGTRKWIAGLGEVPVVEPS